MFVLHKIFSREKALSYFQMWNDSDRMGWKNFLDYDVKHNLFIIPGPGKKGSVWYSEKELSHIEELLKQRLLTDTAIVERFTETLETNWQIIKPYLTDQKVIETADEFQTYYDSLVRWWSSMNTVFVVPDMEEVDERIRNTFLSYRKQSEQYTEKMNKLMTEFWKRKFPEHEGLTFFVTPLEIISLARNLDFELLDTIKKRTNGCVMIDEQIYLINTLEAELARRDLSLDEIVVDDVDEVCGTPAYKGNATGIVKKIIGFDDMKDFKPGNILVTEMTNPDYVPIMKQAAAVVTDEGGTTCHAAIVCRELQIPCIVGTKTATHLFSDGDEVKVDANEGVVRVLKRANE